MANNDFDLPRPTVPVPSSSSIVANDNSKVLDYVVNSEGTVVTRTGKTIPTLDKVLSGLTLDALGYAPTPVNGGVWASGQEFNFYNEYMIYNGEAYSPSPATVLPYTVGTTPDLGFVYQIRLNDAYSIDWNNKTIGYNADDWKGFTESLYAEAGITPNGQPDTAIASQRLDAMKRVVGDYNTPAEMGLEVGLKVGSTPSTRGFYAAGDGGAATYIVEVGAPVSVCDVTLADGLVAKMIRNKNTYPMAALGCLGGNTSNNDIIDSVLAEIKALGNETNKQIYRLEFPIAAKIDRGILFTGSYGRSTVVFCANYFGFDFSGDGSAEIELNYGGIYSDTDNLLFIQQGTPTIESRVNIGFSNFSAVGRGLDQKLIEVINGLDGTAQDYHTESFAKNLFVGGFAYSTINTTNIVCDLSAVGDGVWDGVQFQGRESPTAFKTRREFPDFNNVRTIYYARSGDVAVNAYAVPAFTNCFFSYTIQDYFLFHDETTLAARVIFDNCYFVESLIAGTTGIKVDGGTLAMVNSYVFNSCYFDVPEMVFEFVNNTNSSAEFVSCNSKIRSGNLKGNSNNLFILNASSLGPAVGNTAGVIHRSTLLGNHRQLDFMYIDNPPAVDFMDNLEIGNISGVVYADYYDNRRVSNTTKSTPQLSFVNPAKTITRLTRNLLTITNLTNTTFTNTQQLDVTFTDYSTLDGSETVTFRVDSYTDNSLTTIDGSYEFTIPFSRIFVGDTYVKDGKTFSFVRQNTINIIKITMTNCKIKWALLK